MSKASNSTRALRIALDAGIPDIEDSRKKLAGLKESPI